MEIAILNFGCKIALSLNTAIEKTIEKCVEFYKGIQLVHHQCLILMDTPDQVFPIRGEHLQNLQERLQKGEDSLARLEVVSEKDIDTWIIQASGHQLKLEEALGQSIPKMKGIESQLSKHEVAVCVLELAEYKVISEQTQAWGVFIKTQSGPTQLAYSQIENYVIFCIYPFF